MMFAQKRTEKAGEMATEYFSEKDDKYKAYTRHGRKVFEISEINPNEHRKYCSELSLSTAVTMLFYTQGITLYSRCNFAFGV